MFDNDTEPAMSEYDGELAWFLDVPNGNLVNVKAVAFDNEDEVADDDILSRRLIEHLESMDSKINDLLNTQPIHVMSAVWMMFLILLGSIRVG